MSDQNSPPAVASADPLNIGKESETQSQAESKEAAAPLTPPTAPATATAADIPAGSDDKTSDDKPDMKPISSGEEVATTSSGTSSAPTTSSTASSSSTVVTTAPTTTTSTSTTSGSTIERFPIIRLSQLSMREAQTEVIRRKSAGILGKPLLGRRSASLEGEGVSKMSVAGGGQGGVAVVGATPAPDGGIAEAESGGGTPGQGSSSQSQLPHKVEHILPDYPDPFGASTIIGCCTPSIVKPRRASVHFAVDTESSSSRASGAAPERVRQDSGGSGSRKHRSRKEKLVCRSESPTSGMTSGEPSPLLGPLFPSLGGGFNPPKVQHPGSGLNPSPSTSQGPPSESSTTGTAATMKPPPIYTKGTPKTGTPSTKMVKPRVKRVSSGSGVPRTNNSRKRNANSLSGNTTPSIFKEPTVKKKKVIEIVSPRKRKVDHFDIVKSSSDPIFVRAANKPKPFKLKNKTSHNRLKFSRANLHKANATSFQKGALGSRVRHPSSTSLQPNRGKQRLSGSPQKKEPEAESPGFPPAFVDDLMWLLQDAENEFGPPARSTTQMPESQGSVPNSPLGDSGLRTSADPVPPQAANSSTGLPRGPLPFGRRRVDSEPAGAVGFEMGPGSPTGSQSFYQIRKDLYFSPSPSYAATGPSGRRRYSRRRHAKIHPPFDDTNCHFQGHFCPNPKVLRSQYCEKHLDQGPTAAFSQCRYVKDGKTCGSLVQSFDTMSYCEKHSNIIARAEYESRNPKTQPDQARNIIAKITKIFKEGLTKPGTGGGDSSTATIPDIFQIVDEPEIVQELPLGSYTGGLVEELDIEGERNVNPDKPDYDALKNAGYFTTEEIIQIHINKLRKLKALYQREKELEILTRQQKLRFFRDGLEKLKQFGPRFTTNPYLINTKVTVPPGYIDHQIKQYDAAKAILQTAYKADGQRGLLRLKMLQKTQELARKAKASGRKQHDAADIYDSDTDGDSDGGGETRDKLESTRYSGIKSFKCAYNEGYAVRACQNPPVNWSNFCLKHILSDPKQVQWIPCKRSIGPDPQDVCKTPCYRILEKYGCPLHSPLVLTKHKPLRKSDEELNVLADSDNEEEELTLENESHVLANLVTDECLSVAHLEEALGQLSQRGPLEITDTSDSEETDEEVVSVGSILTTNINDEDDAESPISGHA